MSGERFNIFRILKNAYTSTVSEPPRVHSSGMEMGRDLPLLNFPLHQNLCAGLEVVQVKQEAILILLR